MIEESNHLIAGVADKMSCLRCRSPEAIPVVEKLPEVLNFQAAWMGEYRLFALKHLAMVVKNRRR